MRTAVALIVLGALAMSASAQKLKPVSDLDKISYSLGADIGKNFRMQEIQMNVDMLAQGIKDAMAGGAMAMSEADMEKTVAAFQEVIMKVQQEKAAMAAYENRKEGEEYLAANAKKEGVKSLPSGLQYKVIAEGKGPKPTATDNVTVHYRGTLINGKEFDSSYKRNEPTTFPLNRVIRGWTEGLQLMSVGSKYMLYVPSELGYGDRQMGPDITPGSTLIFEVELLEIKK